MRTPTARLQSSGRYRVLAFVGKDRKGKRKYKSFTADTAAKAEKAARKYVAMHEGETINTDSFGICAEEYNNSQKPMVSPNTYRSYKGFYRTIQNEYPAFFGAEVSSIRTADVQKLLNALKRSGKANKTVRNYWSYINSVLCSMDIHISAPTLPEKVRPDIYVPTDAEVKSMLEITAGKDLEIPILLASTGCMREGEICALDLSDIKGNVIHVHKDVVFPDGGGIEIKNTPKTSASNRRIDMPAFVIKKINNAGKITDMNPRQLRYAFEKMLEENNFNGMRFHDLRHYCASTMHAQGIPDAYIMQRGGWSTDSTLKAVYRHTMADQDKVMVKKANDHFATLEG